MIRRSCLRGSVGSELGAIVAQRLRKNKGKANTTPLPTPPVTACPQRTHLPYHRRIHTYIPQTASAGGGWQGRKEGRKEDVDGHLG